MVYTIVYFLCDILAVVYIMVINLLYITKIFYNMLYSITKFHCVLHPHGCLISNDGRHLKLTTELINLWAHAIVRTEIKFFPLKN